MTSTHLTAEARRDDVLVYLAIAGSRGVRPCDLARVLHVCRDTARDDLIAVRASFVGTSKDRRAVLGGQS